jgi:hypothetical protein
VYYVNKEEYTGEVGVYHSGGDDDSSHLGYYDVFTGINIYRRFGEF